MWYVVIRLLIFPSYSKGRTSPTLFCTLLLFECIYYFFHWLDFLSRPHLLPFLLLLGLNSLSLSFSYISRALCHFDFAVV